MKKILITFLTLILFFTFGCTSTKKSKTEVPTSSKVATSKGEDIKNEDIKKEDTKKTLTNAPNGIPVIMYHSVDYEEGNPIRIPPVKFEKQMEYLKNNNYTTLSLDELYDHLEHNKPIPQKSIVLTFDDGYADNFTNMYPVLKKYGFKATIFAITDTINTDKSYLNEDEIKILDKNNIRVESHTTAHKNLKDMSYNEQLKTLKDSKEKLDKILGREVKYFAYPYGKYNEDTKKALKEAGYKMAVTTSGKWTTRDNGILTLNRVYISGSKGLDNFIYRITNPNY